MVDWFPLKLNLSHLPMIRVASATGAAVLVVALSAASASFAASAQDNWQAYCLRCHGATGEANTPEGQALRARNLADPAFQAQFSNNDLMRNLLAGTVDDSGAPRMPAFKGQITIDEAKDLIAYIRKLQKRRASVASD